MKKIICTIIAISVILTATMITASATNKKYDSLLLLGDSITYGYGLEGDRDTCRSYGNQLRDYLEISTENFTNAAVNGYTSADLLALLPTISDKVKDADLIVVTIGGNDMLGIIWEAVAAASSSREELLAKLNDPIYVASLLERFTMDLITDTIIEYSVNMSAIVSYIRSNNPEARVLFLAQYDLTSGLSLGALGSITSTAVRLLNAQMSESVTAGGCEYVDIYTPFVNRAGELTNMLSLDIHPSQAGHDKIFEVIAEYLGDLTVETEATTLPETTEKLPETTIPPVTESAPETEVLPEETLGVSAEEPAVTQDQTENNAAQENRGCRATLGAETAAVIALAALFLRRRKNK